MSAMKTFPAERNGTQPATGRRVTSACLERLSMSEASPAIADATERHRRRTNYLREWANALADAIARPLEALWAAQEQAVSSCEAAFAASSELRRALRHAAGKASDRNVSEILLGLSAIVEERIPELNHPTAELRSRGLEEVAETVRMALSAFGAALHIEDNNDE